MIYLFFEGIMRNLSSIIVVEAIHKGMIITTTAIVLMNDVLRYSR
jgi:hypothetical protein